MLENALHWPWEEGDRGGNHQAPSSQNFEGTLCTRFNTFHTLHNTFNTFHTVHNTFQSVHNTLHNTFNTFHNTFLNTFHNTAENMKLSNLKGNTIWKQLEKSKVCNGNRTWQSMKEQFRKVFLHLYSSCLFQFFVPQGVFDLYSFLFRRWSFTRSRAFVFRERSCSSSAKD